MPAKPLATLGGELLMTLLLVDMLFAGDIMAPGDSNEAADPPLRGILLRM